MVTDVKTMRPTTSASNLFRRALCPGSARMEAGLPEEDTPQSREGVLLHDYSAHPEYERKVLKPAQRDLLDLNDTLLNEALAQVKLACSEEKGSISIGRRVVEQTLENDLISGTPDVIVFHDEIKNAWVNDSKFGFNIVERAELNLQLRAYAVLVADNAKGTNRVFVSITQPRVSFNERITLAEYTQDDIAKSKSQISLILMRSNGPDAPLVAGEEQCRYCKAKLVCPAFRESMQVPAVITPDTALSKTARELFLAQRLAQISDDQLEKVMLACKLADFAHDPVMDEARERIAAGGMTNYELAKESQVRGVTDVRKALSLLSLAGWKDSDVFDCVTKLAIGKLTEKVRKLNPGYNAKQANEWIDRKLKSVLEIEARKARILRKA